MSATESNGENTLAQTVVGEYLSSSYGFKMRAKELTEQTCHEDRDISVNAFFKALWEVLGIEDERDPEYHTTFYDMDKKAGGDGHASAVDKRKAALVDIDTNGVFTEGPEGERVFATHPEARGSQRMPFAKLNPDEETRAKLIVLCQKYNIQVGQSKMNSSTFIVTPTPEVLKD